MPDRYDDTSEYNWLMEQIMVHESAQAMVLGRLLYLTLHPKSVIDFGCGPGIYLIPFRPYRVKIYGVDGASEAGECLAPDEFDVVDLRQPHNFMSGTNGYYKVGDLIPMPNIIPFDLGICVEVGEHLKPEFHETLVNTIVNSCKMVFWSAAHPGQGGEGHYGEAAPEYWFELFSRRGWAVDQEMTARLHSVIDVHGAFDHTHWLRWHSHLIRPV